jgi:hypothetical protein
MYYDFVNFLKTSPWFPQLAAILTIIGIPTLLLKLIFYKAKHKIFFDPKETYHEVKLVDHPGQPQSFWLHLMVENRGYEISKNAEAYLSEIWVKDKTDLFKKLEEFRAPVKLKWAHEADIHPIDILPKEKRRLDVCYICQNENILYLMARGFPSGTLKNAIPIGNYLFFIKVVSENSLTPSTFIFNVTWNGQWKTLNGSEYIRNFRIYKAPIKSFSIYY